MAKQAMFCIADAYLTPTTADAAFSKPEGY